MQQFVLFAFAALFAQVSVPNSKSAQIFTYLKILIILFYSIIQCAFADEARLAKRAAAAYTDNLPKADYAGLKRDLLTAMDEAVCEESTKATDALAQLKKTDPTFADAALELAVRQAIGDAQLHFLKFEEVWSEMIGKYEKNIPKSVLPFVVKFVGARSDENGAKLARMIYRETDKVWALLKKTSPVTPAAPVAVAAPVTPVIAVAPVAPAAPAVPAGIFGKIAGFFGSQPSAPAVPSI